MPSIVKHAPRFTFEEALAIAEELFWLKESARELPSERDQNYHIATSQGEEFVLKVANATESFEVLDFQNKAMMHINARKKMFDPAVAASPAVCPSRKGEDISTVNDKDGREHFVRLLTYLPGKTFADANPHDHETLTSLGRFFGQFDRALGDFDHPAAHRGFHWDLKNAGEVLSNLINHLDAEEKRAMVKGFLDRFQSEIEPKLSGLRSSVIHNDGNDYNVIVDHEVEWCQEVSGVIDFGDMVYSYTINELAVACAYAMMHKKDPPTAAQHIVFGYHKVNPLTNEELPVLFDLICIRLCMSVCHAAHQSKSNPDNDYLLISEKPAWALLEQLKGINPRFAHYAFRQACGFPASPNSENIVDWLKTHQGEFAPIVDVDLRRENPLVFDLSVDSNLFGVGPDAASTDILIRRLFEEMEKANVRVGIGRYDEARQFYREASFKVLTDEMPEYMTIHLGIDLYVKEGNPVSAFMDGKVHSFRNNDDPFDYGPTIILEHQIPEGDRFYTLYGHLSLESLNGMAPGKVVGKREAFAWIGDAKTNGGWPPHLHFQIITDMLGETGSFPGAARPSQREIWTSICPNPNALLGIPEHCFPKKKRSKEEILDIRSQSFGKNLSISYRKPLKMVRGIGQYLINDEAQAFLDCVNNVCHVGHCHPHVVEAAQKQMAVLNTNTRYLHDNIIEYAERLLSTFPDPLSVCFFVCTGSEANELALRLARTYTGKQDIITVEGAYHGNTQALIDISPYKHDRRGGKGAPPWVHKVAMPDGYRGPYKGADAKTGARYAEHVRDAIQSIRSRDRDVAAFICESILGCGGHVVLPENYLEEAYEYVRAAGGVCIVDEVQVGFGRAGSHFWAFETQNVVPDIVTLGKPMGNGHPIAAVITTSVLADAFANRMEYFNTFGGNPVSCAVGMAVLDVIEKEHLQENALRVGKKLLEGLCGLKEKHPLVGDARGLGLFTGIELVKDRGTLEPAPEHASYVINRAKDYGILLSIDGPLDNIVKMKPPMVFSEQNADEVVQVLDRVLSEDCLQV